MAGYGRALRRACPRCGHAPIFRTFFDLEPGCPSCDLVFERESGYWVGAMIINTAVISFVLLATLVLVVWLTWPEVPWGWLMAGVIVLSIAVPVGFHPFSKTLWMALDLRVTEGVE